MEQIHWFINFKGSFHVEQKKTTPITVPLLVQGELAMLTSLNYWSEKERAYSNDASE